LVAVHPAKTRALVAAVARRILAAKKPGENARFRVDFVKKAAIFVRISSFSPRFNRQVASWAGAECVLPVCRGGANRAQENPI
jgi:hypothetical protein